MFMFCSFVNKKSSGKQKSHFKAVLLENPVLQAHHTIGAFGQRRVMGGKQYGGARLACQIEQ